MAASTSTAAHSNNNSCYDVFISHRGQDVKMTFASHMYHRLIAYGLRVFLDYQELEEGEEFPCQIKGAIRTASVQIAIFSPTYADSRWCLDELVLMLETRAPIIPVFYHVKPNELRWTQGEGVYATSLRNLEKKRKYDSEPRYGSETIQNWRNALSRVAEISGFDLDERFNGDEGKLLDQLVKAVLEKGIKKLNVARYPTGLEEKVDDFETKLSLQQHSERVQFVGITGLGGTGKTTLAKELFNRKSSRYIKSCFLIDVRENVKISVASLQRKLLKDLCGSEKRIDSKDEGLEILRTHFLGLSAPVLLVLDDVDHQDQVHALLPVTDEGILPLPPSSLILITARDKNVLTRSGVQEPTIYKLTGLNPERSRELFCSHAFSQRHPMPGFEDLVNQYIKACNGLPLSLKVFGGLLCGNTDKSYWKSELEELRKALPHEIQKSLQISYDALQPDEKQMFLDIACFFIGQSRDTAITVWKASGWNGSRGFEILLSKCLVELDIIVENPFDMYSIRMHDHLRDMGRYLANNTPGFPCRLWRGTKHTEVLLQQSSEATKVRGIRMLDWEHYCDERADSDSDVDNERASFSRYKMRYKMKNLELLDTDLEGYQLKCFLDGMDPPNLLWFRWRICFCSSLPPYIPMKNLRVFEVEGDELETLWQEDSQTPFRLRELRIRVNVLHKIPKCIGQLKHVELMVVHIRQHYTTVEIPKEFCDLRSLKHLVLQIPQLRSLPDSFGNLSTLEHINLSYCGALERLPDSFGNLSKLEHINLKSCGALERLPDSFGNLSMLEHIDLELCGALERLPDSFGNLSKLEHINLKSCGALERLPDSFGRDLRNLKYLDLRCCQSLRRVSDTFLKLIKLIVDCPLEVLRFETVEGGSETLINLEGRRLLLQLHKTQISEVSIPTRVCNNVQYLDIDIRDCQDLVEVGTLPNALRKLQLINCPKLRKIERLSGFAKLQTLAVSRCKEVEELPSIKDKSVALAESTGPRELNNSDFSSDNCLLHLQHLELRNTAISEVLYPTGVCPNLQYLAIKDCRDLVEVGTLPNALIKLQLIDCPKLRKIERLSGFAKLKTLGVSRCKEVEELPSIKDTSVALAESTGPRELNNSDFSSDNCLPHLQHLELHNTAISEVLYPTGVCPNLQYLDIKDCRDLVEVGTLPNALIKLQLTGCPELRKIALDVRRRKEVEELLSVKGKSDILTETTGQRTSGNLDSSFDKCLNRLQHLELDNTEISKVSFPAGVYPNLRYLSIEHGISLVKFVASPYYILRKLDLWNCSKLRKIEELSGLANLQVLSIAWCEGVEELSSIEILGSLENLQVVWCSKLKSIRVLAKLTKLQELNVSNCSELEDLPGVEHLSSLKKLWACGCKKLKSIRGSAQLTQLRELDVSECSELEELLDIEHLRSLDKLRARNCARLKHLQGLAQLTQLRELDVTGCSRLEEMPGVGYLQSLVWLRASECVKLQSIQGLEQMAQLRELEVSYCFELKELLGVEHLKSLQNLQARSCRKLNNIQGLAQLTQLRQLDVSFCSELKEMSGVEHLQSLLVLRGSECVKLKSLWGLPRLTHLLELDVSGCCELEEMQGVGYLSSLMVLRACECVKLKSIQGLEQLTQLLKLDVSGCSELEELRGVGHLISLNMLRTSGCVKLKSIQVLEQLTQLLELHVCNCFELEELLGIEHLKSLKELLATNCKKLKSIQGLEQVTQLKYLDVSGCYELDKMPDVGCLESLVVLQASECVKLKSIQGLEQMIQLRELDVSYCFELEELPASRTNCKKLKSIQGLEQVTQLKYLDVSGCYELEKMPDVGCLESLVVLRASECVKLKSIQGLEQMTQLRELDVSYCLELEELPGFERLTSLMKLRARCCTKLKRIKGLAQLAQLRELDVSLCTELEERPDVECLQ